MPTETLKPESVELIFKTFTRQFPNRFQKTAEDKAAREVWFRALAAEHVTDAMVRIGLRACIMLEWPPSVGEFIKACTPTAEALGLPSDERVFKEVAAWIRQPVDTAMPAGYSFRWSHDIVFHVAKVIGADSSMRTNPNLRKLVAYHYGVARQRFLAGLPLQKPPPAIEPPAPQPPPTKEAINTFLTGLRRMLGRAA